jgi:hypothetical protein
MLSKQSSWSLCSLEDNVKNRNIQNYISGYNLLDQDICPFSCPQLLLRDISSWIASYLTVFQECPSFVDLKHFKCLCSVLDCQVDFIVDNNDNNPEYNKSPIFTGSTETFSTILNM